MRRANGTTIRRIHAHGDMLPSWSADGRWLVAIRLTYGGTGGDIAKNPGLWVMRADGTDAHRALKTRLLADFFPPEWEPRPG